MYRELTITTCELRLLLYKSYDRTDRSTLTPLPAYKEPPTQTSMKHSMRSVPRWLFHSTVRSVQTDPVHRSPSDQFTLIRSTARLADPADVELVSQHVGSLCPPCYSFPSLSLSSTFLGLGPLWSRPFRPHTRERSMHSEGEANTTTHIQSPLWRPPLTVSFECTCLNIVHEIEGFNQTYLNGQVSWAQTVTRANGRNTNMTSLTSFVGQDEPITKRILICNTFIDHQPVA
jgi:hypothetical protein